MKKKSALIAASLILATLCLAESATLAQVSSPFILSYGGRLADGNGEAVLGPVDIEIKFFKTASGGTPIGISPILKTGVPLDDGVFQVDLEILTAAESHLAFDGTSAVWIEVIDKSHNKTYPRQRLNAVPFALKVPVDSKTVKFDSNGKLHVGPSSIAAAGQFLTSDGSGNFVWDTPSAAASSIATKTITGTPTSSGQVLKYDGTNWTPGTILPSDAGQAGKYLTTDGSGIASWGVPGGSGDITDVVAGTGLTGGSTSGSATLNVNIGTGANQVVALDASAYLPAVNGSQLTSLNGSNITSGTVGSSYLPATLSYLGTDIDSSEIVDGAITNADINASAAIDDTKLAQITTANKVSGSAITGLIGGTTSLDTSGAIKTSGELAALGNGSSVPGQLYFKDADNTNYIALKAPVSVGTDAVYELPAVDGSPGHVLSTNGSGVLSWVTTGGGGTVTSVDIAVPASGLSISGGPVTGSGTLTLALSNDLAALESLSTTGGIERTGADAWATYSLTTVGKSFLGASTVGAQRTALGLDIGVDVQAYDSDLVSIAGLTTAADEMLYISAPGIYATTPLSSFSRSLLAGTSASAMRTTLGVDGAVNGPATATDFAVARFDGATGKLIKNSTVSISDSGDIATTGTVHAYDFALGISSTATSPGLSLNDLDTGIFSNTPDNIGFSTGGVERMRIDAGGNVGVGTIAPAEKLEVFNGNVKVVNGVFIGAMSGTAGASIDFASGNIQETTSGPSGLAMNNMRDGTWYTLILSSGSSGVYTLSGSGISSFFCEPDCPGAQIQKAPSTKMVINMIKSGANAYVSYQKPSLRTVAVTADSTTSCTPGPNYGFTSSTGGSGTCSFNFVDTFTSTPVCTCSAGVSNKICMIASVSPSTVSVNTQASGTNAGAVFHLTCSGQ